MPTRDDERYLDKLLKDLCLSPMTRPWAKFFRQEMAKPYFADLDSFVTSKWVRNHIPAGIPNFQCFLCGT